MEEVNLSSVMETGQKQNRNLSIVKKVNLGTWLEEEEVDAIAERLNEDFGEENVFVKSGAQYFNSIVNFSLMRGENLKELEESATMALLNL